MDPKILALVAVLVIQVSCEPKNSLTFVIDDTASMNDELSQVKEAAKSIVDIVLNVKASQIEDIVLVTFNDPSVEFRKRTRDANELKRSLDAINPHGGDYCPEMALTGIELALEESLPGSYLFVFTDAGACDEHKLNDIISLSQEKQSQIVFVLTGECGGIDIYYKIAAASNGQVFRISKDEVGQVLEYVKETIKGDQSVITNIVVPALEWYNVPFTIDDETEYAIVSASGKRVILKIIDSYNSEISGYTPITWTENVKVLKLTNLSPGTYFVQVYGTTNVNVRISGRTDFTFEYGFSNQQENSLRATETQPTIGTPTHLMISVKDEEHSVTVQAVQILDMDENVLRTLPLTDKGGNVYATQQFVPPEHTFKVAVKAIGRSTRRPLRRIAKTPVAPIRPVTVSPEIIDSEPYLKKEEGSTVDLQCRIRKGKPKPSITWFFMKKGTTDYVQMRDKNDDVLHLTNVLMDNEGHYKCVAENTVGRAEHIVQLEVEVAPMIAHSETYLKKREGSTVDFSCRILKGNPRPNIRWFFMKKGTRDYVQMWHTTNEVLRLTNVLMDNEGHYKCVAENTVARAEHRVQLEVEVAPMIAHSETYLKKREGSTVDFSCRILKGNPRPNIRWFFMKKGTRDYVQMWHTTNEVLRLTNVLMDNEGHYKCVAENTVARAEHRVQLEVEVAPMIAHSETYLNKREGSTVDFSCRILKGNPRPNIRWFFMKKGTRDYVQMWHTTNEVLRLTNVLMDNEGHYKCVAENTVARAEHVVQLEVEVAPKIADSETHLKNREGSTVDIGCRIQKGNPTPNIKWFFMKKGTTDYVQMRDTTNEVLRLTNVLMDNEGHYKCVAENTVARAEHIVQLEVEVAPKIADSEIYLQKREGSTVDIGCRIQKGNPTPNIRWFFMKKGTRDYVQMWHTTNEVLRLINVLMDNEGHYKCVAENTVARTEHIVQLEVEVAPKIADSETHLKNREGSTVDIGCRIQKGNPTPNIRWFFMKKGTTDYVQMRDTTNEVLRLTNVLMDNEGHYKCVAENTVARAEHIVQLEVEVAPKIADSETHLKNREGSTVEIRCRIQKGNPRPNIRWFFMKKGTSGYVQMRDTTNEVLRLTNVLMDNEGHYKCVAENTVGRAEHIVQLEVEVAPKIADSEIYLKKREGSTVDIGCRIQKGNPTPNIRWFFMKKGTRDYVQMRDTTNEVLRLTNVLMDNEGHYKCVAENTVARAEHIVQLEVEVAPKIADSETHLKNREGSTVEIRCRIQKGNPRPNIRWFFMKKGTSDYLQMRDTTNEVLRLTNVLMDNEGHYKCVAENTVGRTEHIVQIEVEVAPKIADSETYLKKREGSTVGIGCSIQNGNPKPNITWFFMKKGTRDYVQMRDTTNEVLRLTNVLMDNEGHYKCVAENTVARAEHIVQLEVEVAPKIADSETYLKKREGSTVNIGCRIQKGNPRPNIRWFFMKKGTRDYVQMRDATNGVLRLTNVLMDNEGHYKCVAENTVGRAELIVQLEVEVAPKIADSESYLKKRDGSTVDIGCRIQKGHPTPNIRWFFMKKGTRDYVQMRDTTNEVLRLTNVLMDNEGHYKCVAENTVGRAEHIVQLEVEVAPKIADSETHLKKREGSTVDIECRIQKGNPRPNTRWFFMKKGTRDYVQIRDTTNEVLRLTNVLMDNEGYYKCVAENTVGRAEHILQLEVEVAPKIADSETHLKKREGSTVDIECRIQKGNPRPNIRWFFMKKGTRDYVQMRDTTNEVLRLTNVLMDNEGHYKCVAENTVGRAEHIVQLEVEVAPKIADSETYLKKRQGSTVDIGCRILQGKPQPRITWFFKQQGARAFDLLKNKTEQVLHLTNIVMDNAGDYKCVAENVVNRAEHVVQLEVEVPPRIVFSPPNEPKYRGVEGDVVMKLSCIAEGHPKPIISWTIDNYTIGTDKSNQSYVDDGSLFLKNPISANSNNIYVCVATNAAGEQRQTYEVLISEFEDYNQPEKMYGEVGKPYEINCSLPFTDPNSVRWFYNSVSLNVTGASIRWESASRANDGNYTCRVSELSGAASVTVELTFGLPPSPSSGRTEFEEEWDDTLQVACMADLNMIGTYEWYLNGERIRDANERELNVNQFGFGNYTCRAANPLGSLNITYNIPSEDCVIDKNLWTTKKMPVIIDNTPAWPTFSHNQKFVVVPQSEKLHLVCQDDPPRGKLGQPNSLNNSFTKFPSLKSIEATCDHEDTFLVDGVSHKISELDCISSVMPSVVSTGKQCLGDNTQMIDVGFYVDDLIKVYSSCLDTNRNLLLYTTVNMNGLDVSRWTREPERPCTQVADCCYETVELVTAEDVGFGAAEWASLKEPRNSVFYCRPSDDTMTQQTTTESSPRPSADTTEIPSLQRSTTELPPDPETSWHDIERQVRNGPRMTVWSGAGNYTRVANMMVPQYLWKVVKNLDDDMSVAIVHSNALAPIPKLCADDCGSSSVLALFEPHGVRTYCCSVDEFKTAFNLPLPF